MRCWRQRGMPLRKWCTEIALSITSFRGARDGASSFFALRAAGFRFGKVRRHENHGI